MPAERCFCLLSDRKPARVSPASCCRRRDIRSVADYNRFAAQQHMTPKQYNRIKAVLAENNKTSKELALHLGVQEPTVSNWCTNKKQPSIENLYNIAKFLKVDIRELLVSTKW